MSCQFTPGKKSRDSQVPGNRQMVYTHVPASTDGIYDIRLPVVTRSTDLENRLPERPDRYCNVTTETGTAHTACVLVQVPYNTIPYRALFFKYTHHERHIIMIAHQDYYHTILQYIGLHNVTIIVEAKLLRIRGLGRTSWNALHDSFHLRLVVGDKRVRDIIITYVKA